MYRELATPAEGAAATEFTYAPRFAGMTGTVIVVVLASAVSAIGLEDFGRRFDLPAGTGYLVAVIACLAVLFRVGMRARRSRRLTRLRIDGHLLEITTPAFHGTPIRLPMGELLDVTLDSDVVERLTEGPSPFPETRFIGVRASVVAQPVDVARIVLTFRDGSRIPLSDERLSHLETSEVYGKMRVFLRRHGWRPADEAA